MWFSSFLECGLVQREPFHRRADGQVPPLHEAIGGIPELEVYIPSGGIMAPGAALRFTKPIVLKPVS